MKALFLTIFAFTLMACNSTVQIDNQSPAVEDESAIEVGFNGTMYDTRIYFYDDNDNIIKTEKVGNILIGNKSLKYKTHKRAIYYKIKWMTLDTNTKFGEYMEKFGNISKFKHSTIENTPIDRGNNIYVVDGNTLTR